MTDQPAAPVAREPGAPTPGEAIVIVDDGDVIRSWSRAAADLFGYEAHEIVGQPFATLVPPKHLASCEPEWSTARAGEPRGVPGFETEHLTRSGARVKISVTRSALVDGSGASHNQCCVIRDLGAQRAMVRRLYESEKLVALRAMLVGLAHEIGNPLAGVLAVLQLVQRRTGEPETRRRLQQGRDELTRVGRIIRELTDFTRSDGAAGVIDVNAILREALAFARYAHEGAAVTVTLTTDSSVPAFAGSRDHLLQACLHLVMNAYDAMREGGGSLTVGSARRDGEVVIRFEDTGKGIEPDVLTRIFEPFFTTKADGQGTGLGLFVCHRIVTEELGGRIEVTSQVGRGSRFELTLPIVLRPTARTAPGS